ncbi:MAG: cory-CC-star protein [Halorhodospira sp.]
MSEDQRSWWGLVQHLLDRYDEMLRLGHDAEVKRELQEQEDIIMLMLFGEAMGLPNPAAYYTLELYPALIESYHEWHKRMGMEHSPLDHIRCC